MKMIQTNARYLNAFAEKHELLGLSREQFAEEFAAVPPAQLPPNLPCAFTRNFHRSFIAFSNLILYYAHYSNLDKIFQINKSLIKIRKELRTALPFKFFSQYLTLILDLKMLRNFLTCE